MLTQEELRKLVDDTYINFPEEELQNLDENLVETMKIFEAFEAFEMSEDVEPLFYPNVQEYTFRDKTVTFDANREELLSNTKETKDGYFVFPSVLKGESEDNE